MKKWMVLLIVCVISVSFLTLAFAQQPKPPMKEPMKQSMTKSGMMNKEMKMGEKEMTGMHEWCGMAMGTMMGHSMVASGDGGVIVMMGDKLQKYDKDLNLVKEIQVTFDMEHMSKMMAQMMTMCPMHQNMMQGGMMQGGTMQGQMDTGK